VKPARENLVYCIARGRNTATALTTISGFSNNYDGCLIKGQLRSVLSILHEHTIITISEDVMNTVIKPISLFLNDIGKNTIFTHNPANAKGVSNYDIVDKKLPVFFYTSSKGGYV
jgi:hypothetical protein